ncbi:MAG: hypothetical protein ACK5D5_05180 [Bacteroidota bacterium]
MGLKTAEGGNFFKMTIREKIKDGIRGKNKWLVSTCSFRQAQRAY